MSKTYKLMIFFIIVQNNNNDNKVILRTLEVNSRGQKDKINPRNFPLFRSRMRPPIYNDSTLSVANTTGSGEKKSLFKNSYQKIR